MIKSFSPTRVLVTLTLLLALAVITTPAAASTGAESALGPAYANMGSPLGVGTECAWWIPWC